MVLEDCLGGTVEERGDCLEKHRMALEFCGDQLRCEVIVWGKA